MMAIEQRHGREVKDNRYYLKALMGLFLRAAERYELLREQEKELLELYEENANQLKELRAERLAIIDFYNDCRLRNVLYMQQTPMTIVERKVIMYRYTKDYRTWERVATKVQMDKRTILYANRRAIEKIARRFSDVDFKALYRQQSERFERECMSLPE